MGRRRCYDNCMPTSCCIPVNNCGWNNCGWNCGCNNNCWNNCGCNNWGCNNNCGCNNNWGCNNNCGCGCGNNGLLLALMLLGGC